MAMTVVTSPRYFYVRLQEPDTTLIRAGPASRISQASREASVGCASHSLDSRNIPSAALKTDNQCLDESYQAHHTLYSSKMALDSIQQGEPSDKR